MKKIISMLLICILLISNSLCASAQSNSNVSVEYLDDGSYFITVIDEDEITPFSSTISKSKTSYYVSASNVKLWSVTVTGTFTYGNNTSKCISSSVSTKSYSSAWKYVSKSASKSGNTARAKATYKHIVNGTIQNTVSRTVSLSCSSNGKLS